MAIGLMSRECDKKSVPIGKGVEDKSTVRFEQVAHRERKALRLSELCLIVESKRQFPLL